MSFSSPCGQVRPSLRAGYLQFTSQKLTDYQWQRGCKHVFSSAYWPRGNCAVATFYRTFETWISGMPSTVKFNDEVRPRLSLYRATPHCTTGRSPSEMLHGRIMRFGLPSVSSGAVEEPKVEGCITSSGGTNAHMMCDMG